MEDVFERFRGQVGAAQQVQRARLEILAAAPELAIAGGAVEDPEIAGGIVFGEDQDEGEGRVEKVFERFLGKMDLRPFRPGSGFPRVLSITIPTPT
jgi:hypothetical protein